MARLRLARAAEDDIFDILAWSHARFGEAARRRYEHLIATALADIGANPDRPGSLARPELGVGARTWHLRGSRDRTGEVAGAVQRPRHFLIYRLTEDLVVVARVLHDAMELYRHMTEPDAWD